MNLVYTRVIPQVLVALRSKSWVRNRLTFLGFRFLIQLRVWIVLCRYWTVLWRHHFFRAVSRRACLIVRCATDRNWYFLTCYCIESYIMLHTSLSALEALLETILWDYFEQFNSFIFPSYINKLKVFLTLSCTFARNPMFTAYSDFIKHGVCKFKNLV